MEKVEHLYLRLSRYFTERFGKRVHRVSVDAGFSCPNRDGTLGVGGCIFCNNTAFSSNTSVGEKLSLEEQVRRGIERARRRYGAEAFMLYFQAYTGTYDTPENLRRRYDVIRRFPEMVALSVATRPDCIDESRAELLASYAGDYEVWVELGLQSIHECTLRYVNRRHSVACFERAVELLRRAGGIKICVHLVIGLPYADGAVEDMEMVIQTADRLAALAIDGVKIHPLHVVKGTPLHRLYERGAYRPLEMHEYAEAAVEFIEHLPPRCVVHRVGADCPKDMLVAPQWITRKQELLALVEEIFRRRGTRQGEKMKKGEPAWTDAVS